MRSGEEQTEVAAVLMAGYTHLYDNAADFDAVSQELRTRGSDPEPSVLVAVLHQRLVGTVALSCQPLDGNIAVPSGAVSLRRLAVHPRFCRQGIATRLVSGALDLARSMGMQRVGLQTDEDMVRPAACTRSSDSARLPSLTPTSASASPPSACTSASRR